MDAKPSMSRSIRAKVDLGHHHLHQQPEEVDSVPVRATSSTSFFSDSSRCDSALSDASSASWAEELEVEGTQRGAYLLQRLNDALYSDNVHLPGELGEECQLWRQKFPHFRVEGEALTLPARSKSQSRPDSPTAEEEEVFASHGSLNSNESLH